MSSKIKQIFFVFVQNKDNPDIEIKDIKSFNNELQNVKKIYTVEVDKKKADLYRIIFKKLTKFKTFTLLFLDKNKQILYFSENIKFKNDVDNFIYDFKIYKDTATLIKVVTIGIYNSKEYDYIRLKKLDQFKIFLHYIDKTYSKIIIPENEKDNLITQTILVIAKSQNIAFSLYLTIFKEIYQFQKITSLLKYFKIEKFTFDEKIQDSITYTKFLQYNLKNPTYYDKFLKNEKVEAQKICINNYYLFALLYFYYYDINYILELINPDKNKIKDSETLKKINARANQMKNLIKTNLKYFPNLPGTIIGIVNKENISDINNIKDLNKVLAKKMKLEDKLKIIIDKDKFKFISYNDTIRIKSVDTQISKDDNLDFITKSLEKIIMHGREKKYFLLELDSEIWKKYINLFVQEKTIDNIYKIKNCVFQFTFDYQTTQFIDAELLKLGAKMIKEKSLKNERVIEFFTNYYLKTTKTIYPYNFLFLADGIFINEANENFFIQFQDQFFKKFFNQYYPKFIEKIILNIYNFDDFIFVFNIFPPQPKYKIEKNIIDTIVNCLWKNIEKEENIENSTKFNQIMFNIILIYFYNNYKYEDFLKQLNNKGIKKEIIKKFYLWIISIYGGEYKEFIDHSINFLCSDKTDTNYDDTINILVQLRNNNDALSSYFNNRNIVQKVIKENDFKKPSSNFKFLSLLVENSFFEEDLRDKLKNTSYYSNTISFINTLLNKYQNLNFDYNEALDLYKIKDKLEEKFNVIYYNDFNKGYDLYGKIESILENFIELKTNTELIEKYINKFFKKDKKINKLISLFNSKLATCKVSEYDKYLTEYNSNYKEHLENAKKCTKLIQSIFFSNLYKYYEKENPNETDKYLLDQAIKKFEELKDILDESSLNNISKETFNIILENIKDEKEIKKELKTLKEHFEEEEKDTTQIEKSLLLLSQREFILFSISDILFILEKLNVNKTDYSEKLKEINSEINTESSLAELVKVSNILSELDINVKKQHESLKILRILNNKSSLLDFLLEKTEEDIRNLTEFVNENDNSFLKSGDIQLLMKCSEFIQELTEKKNNLNDKEFIDSFHELVKLEKYKSIEAYFQNSSDNFTAIKDLYSQNVDRSQFTKQKIKEIYTCSKFEIKNTQKIVDCFVEYGFDYDKKITFDEILDLRDRSMLQKAESTENENDLQMIIKNYNNVINQIEILREDIEDLISKGYPVDFCFKIYMNKEDVFIEIEKPKEIRTILKERNKGEKQDKYSIRQISLIIREELDNLIKSQFKGYINKEVIRFIYGRQFNHLIKYIRLRIGNVDNFLKYFTNNKITKIPDFAYVRDDDYNIFEDMLNNCELFLNYVLTDNQLKIEDIYESNIIKRPGYEGLHLYYMKVEDMEKGIIEWYELLTGNISTAHTTLLCNEDTTIEEIIAFLFRAIFCKYYVFFTITNVEYLSLDVKNKINEILNIFYKENKDQMKSCLNFVFNSKESEIYEQIRELGGKILQAKDFKNVKASIKKKNIKIVYSDASGVGKSTKIKNEIINSGKTYIYMPIGGEFTREEIINRLLKIEFEKEKETAIHIDITETKKKDLMKEFLFSFLINKCYKESENLFYLNDNVDIYIEIPFGFTDFFNEYKLLTLFQNKIKIEKNKLDPLIISEKLDSDIQVVCNYLKKLDENEDLIAHNNIIIPGISLNENESGIKAQVIDQKSCEQLIRKYFKESSPTYYQICSFISVLAHQLKYFTKNIYFNVQTMQDMNGANNLSVRTDCIKAFINITSYFTKGAYGKLLNSQDINIALQEGGSDEKAINLLTDNKDIVSYDKINPSLIFLNDDGQSMTIICTMDKNTTEYKKLYALYNSMNYGAKKPLINYKTLGRIEYLTQIKQVLDLKNEIDTDFPIYADYNDKEYEPQLREIENKIIAENPNMDKKSEEFNEIFKKRRPIIKTYKKLTDVIGSYVFTGDNFIKMILILHRIRANIPVIMMGETGCGKTSLIRIISDLKMNEMKILNIHAGITDDDILQFMISNNFIEGYDEEMKKAEKENLLENELMKAREGDDGFNPYFYDQDKKPELLPEEEEENKDEEKTTKVKNSDKEIEEKKWVFLDEINTCNSMGLISEMMCKHTIFGKKIKPNVVFIAACNPYRRVEKTQLVANVGLVKNQKVRNLVYNVNPLPHSLLNFVFDFGNLSSEDEERYIISMVSRPIELLYSEIKLNKNLINEKGENLELNENQKNELANINKEMKDVKDKAVKCIVNAQNYVRYLYGKSSVSLREVRRFIILYEYFVGYLRKKKEDILKNGNNKKYEKPDLLFYKTLSRKDIFINAISLSIYICYYLRINSKKHRVKLEDNMENYISNFLSLPQREQKFLANRIKPPEGIAKNRALLENIFTLFFCINCKIPVFICGKPGCSKSLSVQLLYKAMRGDSSDDDFFKKIPRLFMNSYQGSLTSTSKGVLNIFKKARDVIRGSKNNDNKDSIISMIYFDEMGLAEIAKSNPLKVIHSQLEYDENKDKVAFVGISNWALDASKMNRGIYLSIPESDLEDLQLTAITIAESYGDKLKRFNDLFNNLAEAYYKYKNYLKAEHPKQEDFHGSRDFYNLIKIASKKIRSLMDEQDNITKDDQIKIAINSIERNFGGLDYSLTQFKSILKSLIPNAYPIEDYNVMDCINHNIEDTTSRYLLVVSDNATYLLSSILERMNKKFIFIIGSQFEKDLESENYAVKILNQIQLSMEEGNILVLKDLQTIYPSLYDLFNQNFTSVGGKNFSRIAIGGSNNILAHVNENFRCIILVEEKDIEKEDPPFLNRFEKHIISFDNLINKQISDYINEIFDKIKDLVSIGQYQKDLQISFKNQIINCGKEEIKGIVYSIIKDKSLDTIYEEGELKEIEMKVMKYIVPTFSQDIIGISKFSNFERRYKEDLENIYMIYKETHRNNITELLQKANSYKNIIYTFSSILEHINIKEIETPIIGKIENDNIENILVSKYKSELELEKSLGDLYLNKNKKVLIIRFTPNDLKYISLIKFLIENLEREKKYENQNDKNDKDNIGENIIENEKENEIEKLIPENKNIENQKMIIFIIHTTRFLKNYVYTKEEKIEKSIEGKELISHLANYSQIFIDNLNGSSINILDIINLRNEEFIDNEQIINIRETIYNNIYNSFVKINYTFKNKIKNLEESRYIEDNIKKIMKNQAIINKIVGILKKQLQTTDKHLLIQLFLGNNLKKNDIDIIKVLKNYLSDLLSGYLDKFIVKVEKDNILYSLLNMSEFSSNNEKEENIIEEEEINTSTKPEEHKDENEIIIEQKDEEKNEIIAENKEEDINSLDNYIKQLYIEYFNNLDFTDFKIGNKNRINIILGLKIPMLKMALMKIKNYIETNLKEKYSSMEMTFRNAYEEDEDSLDKVFNEYFANQKDLAENLYNELFKYDYFIKFREDISNEKLDNEIESYILRDYFKIFLIKSYNKDLSQIEEFIFLLINKRFPDKKEDIFVDICDKLLWIESNSEIIIKLIDIYNYLSEFIDDLLDKIKAIIDSGVVKYEVSERSPKNKKEANEAIYLIFESLLIVILNNELINNKQGDKVKFFQFLQTVKQLYDIANQVELNLILYSKHIFTIFVFLSIVNCLNKYQLGEHEILLKIIEMLNEENKFLEEKEIDKVSDKLKEEYNLLKELLYEKEDFPDLIITISLAKAKQSREKKFRKAILEIIFSENSFILKSKNVLILILSAYQFEPEELRIDEDDLALKEDETDKEQKQRINKLKADKKNILINEYMSFNNDADDILSLIEEKQNNVLDEILFDHFDSLINEFFLYLNDDEKLFEISIEYFKKNILSLEKIFNNENTDEFNYKHITLLYSITYIKNYLSNFVDILYDNQRFQDIGSCARILNILNEKKDAIRKMLKIYILKLFRNKMDSFTDFKRYNYTDKIDFFEDFEYTEKVTSNIDFAFMPMNNIEDFNKINDCYKKGIDNNINEILNLIRKNGFSFFYDLSANKVLSNLLKENYLEEQEYKSFITSFKNKIYDKINLNESQKNLIDLFYNEEIYKNKTKRKLGGEILHISLPQLEMLLYSYRFCIMFSELVNNNLYKNILTKDAINFINNNYIPGIDSKPNYYQIAIDELPNWFNSNNVYENGAYVCSCGYWYSVPPCGYPTTIGNCPKCGEKIGGTGHIPVVRENHMRIFKDQDNINKINYNFYTYGGFKYMIFDDFKRFCQDKLKSSEIKGICSIDYNLFINETKEVRKLSSISYRLLNFMIYSCIHFSNILGYLTDQQVEKLIPPFTTTFQILEEDWNLLKKALFEKGIQNCQIFINVILPELFEVMKQYENLETIEKRNEFEEKINVLINNTISNKNLFEKYEENNNIYLGLELTSMKAILQEIFPPNDYDENQYPYLKYFMIRLSPSENLLLNYLRRIPDYINKYPIINAFLNDEFKIQIDLLQNIILMNPLIDYMINKYSYNITRDKAKDIKISEILTNPDDKYLTTYFKDFIKGWNNVKENAIKYKCRNEMPVKTIKEDDSIAYILNDDGEMYYGMYLAAAYQNFCDYQNNFLNSIINNMSSDKFFFLIDKIKIEIPPQIAKKNDIVSFDFNNSIYHSFNELITQYSIKNCFSNDCKINYDNYKQIKFDFDSIEEELGKIILPGKRLFSNNQKFVTYGFEGYRGDKSSVIQTFDDKYPQEDLKENEKAALNSFLQENHDFNQIMFSIQLLIFYLSKENENKEKSLNEILSKIPSYVQINQDLKSFLNRNELFKLKHLLAIYEYIERLCYNQIEENVIADYHIEVSKETKEIIENYYKEISPDSIITRKILADAVRKFVSRFLTGKRQEMDINGDVDIFLFISKNELWPRNFTDDNKFEIEFSKIQDIFNAKGKIKVNQAVKLYRILLPEEKASEEAGPEKGEIKQVNENNVKPKNVQEGIKIISRRPRKPKY